MELSGLQGVGKVRLTAMHAAGIFSLRDLLYTVPFKYRDASLCLAVRQAIPGQAASFLLRRDGMPQLHRFGKSCRVTCRFQDDTGALTACWFNQPWMKEHLMKQSTYLLHGRVERYGDGLQLQNPTLEKALRIVPVYRPIEGLPSKTQETLVAQVLPQVEAICTETLPARVLEEHGLMGCAQAIQALHAPPSMAEVQQAQRRFAFEQWLLYQAAVRLVKGERKRGIPMKTEGALQRDYWASLPFTPTQAQQRTLGEISADMGQPVAMARMVQGDVGCGKTAIAFGAMLLCARSGYQAALMAPTEILARQHYQSARPYFEAQGITCGLLTGGMPAKERREALRHLAEGGWQVVIGTHALISKDVAYQRLGLCITDEQHRFGVGQRTELIGKGTQGQGQDGPAPHLLVMSATPIPRSLALVMFGDLDVSVVDQLPPGRMPVTTRIVPEAKRQDMYAFVRKEVEQGRQAYIVCPLVEESEAAEELKAVTTHMESLQKGPFKGLALGMTHGKQPAAQKEQVIDAFARGELQVLVATTVIEVGVNVPNATLMLIEDADRYGLAQLHQLRGRVGRGAQQSWCFLLARENDRLRALVRTNDGFEIAREDLEQRGPGEILGTQQHGVGGVYGGLAFGDMPLLYQAAACAEALEADPARQGEWRQVKALARGLLDKVSTRVSVS